jgi:predicted MFS family arabinose efflux permease
MGQTTLPLLASQALRLRPSTIGYVVAAGGVLSVATMVVVASRIPTSKVRSALVVALVVLAAGFPLIGEARSTPVLVIGVFVLAIGGALVFPTLVTAVGARPGGGSSRGARDRPIAVLSVALSASLALGPFVESGVLALSGENLRSTFLWFTLAPVLAAAVAWATVRHRPAAGDRSAPPSDARHVAAVEMLTGEVPTVGSGSALDPAAARLTFWRALRDGSFRVALLGQLVYTAPFAAIVVYGALFARRDYGMSVTGVQVAFGVFFAMSFLVRALIAWRSPIHHKLAWFQVAAALTLAGLVVAAAGHSAMVLLLAMALLGVPHGLTFPLAMGIVADGRPHAQLSSANAQLSAAVGVLSLLATPLLGVGIDALGYRSTFLVLLVPVALAALAQWHVGSRQSHLTRREGGGAGLAEDLRFPAGREHP